MIKKFLILTFSFILLFLPNETFAQNSQVSYQLACRNNKVYISFSMPNRSSLSSTRVQTEASSFYYQIEYKIENQERNFHRVYQGQNNNFDWSSRSLSTSYKYRFQFKIGNNYALVRDIQDSLGSDIVVDVKSENPCSQSGDSQTTTTQTNTTASQPSSRALRLENGCSASGDPIVTINYSSASKDKTYVIKRSGPGFSDFEIFRGSLYNQTFTDGKALSILENTKYTYKVFENSRIVQDSSNSITTNACNKTDPAQPAAPANPATTGATSTTTQYDTICAGRAECIMDSNLFTIKRDEAAAAEVAGECKETGRGECLSTDRLMHWVIRDCHGKVIDTEKEGHEACTPPGSSAAGNASTRGGSTPAAPAAVTSNVPRVTAPQTQKSQRREEILNAWCAAYLGADTEKGNDCVDKAGDKCKDPNLSNETTFTNCVKGVGLEMQRGTQPVSPPTGQPSNQGQAGDSSTPSDITIIPTINGNQNIDKPLPQNTKTVNIGVKVFKTGDPSETPLSLNNIELILVRTTDERSALITPPTRITDLKTEDGANANIRAVQNYTPYVAAIPGWGQYQLSAQVNGKISKGVPFKVGGLGSGSGTAELPKIFACTVKVESKTSDTIKVSATEVPNTNLVGYDRVVWYLKKGGPNDIESDQYRVGTNVQFPSKQETIFNNLEANTRYTVLGVAYPTNLQANRVPCNSITGVDVVTPAKTGANKPASVKVAQAQANQQVLAATSDDSGPTSVSVAVSCNGSCQVIAQGGDETFTTQVFGTEVVNIPVADRANTRSVTVTVIPVTDQDESVNAQTITIPLPGASGEFTNTSTAATTQNITLSKTPLEEKLTSPELVNLIAETSLPLEGEVAFINKNNPEQKYIVQPEDMDLKCASDTSQVCVYIVHLSKTQGTLEDGQYSFQLVQNGNPLSENTIDFEVSSGNSATGEGNTEIPTKITFSRDDGTEEQVVFTRDPFNPEQVYYADAEFDTLEFDTPYGFRFNIYYNFSDENPDSQVRTGTRVKSAADTPAQSELQEGDACPSEEDYSEACDNGGTKLCHKTFQNGTCQYSFCDACSEPGNGEPNTPAPQTEADCKGNSDKAQYDANRICNYTWNNCTQTPDWDLTNCREISEGAPLPQDNCQSKHNEDQEVGPGCFQSYTVCDDNGSKEPNGGPWSPDTGESCTPEQ